VDGVINIPHEADPADELVDQTDAPAGNGAGLVGDLVMKGVVRENGSGRRSRSAFGDGVRDASCVCGTNAGKWFSLEILLWGGGSGRVAMTKTAETQGDFKLSPRPLKKHGS
jgi:hypothetical protein